MPILHVLKLDFIKIINSLGSFTKKTKDLPCIKDLTNYRAGIYLKAGLGDFIQLIPLIVTLSLKIKSITLFTTHEINELKSLMILPSNIEVILCKENKIIKKIRLLITELKFFLLNEFDFLYFPPIGISISMTLVAACSSAKYKIGFANSYIDNFLDKTFHCNSFTNAITMNTWFLNLYGIPILTLKSYFGSLEEIKEKRDYILRKNFSKESDYICIYPHSVNKYQYEDKLIPIEAFSEILKFFNGKKKQFVFLGSKNDSQYIEQLTCNLAHENYIDLSGEDLSLTLEFIKECKGIIGIDGGIMHIAQLLCKKKITIWNQSNFLIYGYFDSRNLNIHYKGFNNYECNQSFYNNYSITKVINDFIYCESSNLENLFRAEQPSIKL